MLCNLIRDSRLSFLSSVTTDPIHPSDHCQSHGWRCTTYIKFVTLIPYHGFPSCSTTLGSSSRDACGAFQHNIIINPRTLWQLYFGLSCEVGSHFLHLTYSWKNTLIIFRDSDKWTDDDTTLTETKKANSSWLGRKRRSPNFSSSLEVLKTLYTLRGL